MKIECKELIDKFKSDFDFLLSLSRFSEACFLAIYKSVKEAFDPTAAISDCLQICHRSQEVEI